MGPGVDVACKHLDLRALGKCRERLLRPAASVGSQPIKSVRCGGVVAGGTTIADLVGTLEDNRAQSAPVRLTWAINESQTACLAHCNDRPAHKHMDTSDPVRRVRPHASPPSRTPWHASRT